MVIALIGFLAALNPAAAALALAPDRRTDRPGPVATGTAAAVVVLALLGVAGDTVVDLLDINLGTYQLGAGTVVAVAGLRWLIAGTPQPAHAPDSDAAMAGFVAFPALLTPGAMAWAVSVGADAGPVEAVVGAAVAAALGGAGLFLRRSIPAPALAGLSRALGALAVVVGVALAVEGVRTL